MTTADTAQLSSAVETAWNTALGVDRTYAPDDDFFLLGGHSLLALHVADALQTTLDRPVTVRTVLSNTRFGDLLDALESS